MKGRVSHISGDGDVHMLNDTGTQRVHPYLHGSSKQAQRAANASTPTRPGAGANKTSGKAVLMNPKVNLERDCFNFQFWRKRHALPVRHTNTGLSGLGGRRREQQTRLRLLRPPPCRPSDDAYAHPPHLPPFPAKQHQNTGASRHGRRPRLPAASAGAAQDRARRGGEIVSGGLYPGTCVLVRIFYYIIYDV